MVVFERAPDSWQALEPPFFHPYEVPAAISVAELLATAKKRRQAVVQRVKFMGEKGGEAQALAIYIHLCQDLEGGCTGIYGRPFHSQRAGSAIW